jgi:hypothetical protein
MACAICQNRRPRRFCPGVRGDICAVCCGSEREVSVNCPLDCEYLRQAHIHERLAPPDPETIPNRDIPLTDGLLERNNELAAFLAGRLAAAALNTTGAVDSDVREALESLIRTYRTLESGVYYESLPENPLAAAIFRRVREGADQFREREKEETGISRTRDSDVLAMLVFLQRVEMGRNNGRPRGRAFIDALMQNYPGGPAEPPSPASSLLIP